MALGETILVLLTDRPRSGYELAKALDPLTGFSWRADHQQVYRELVQLQAQGLIAGEVMAQKTRPDKKIYTLTDDGRQHLSGWFRQPTTARDLKDDLVVRMFAADAGNLDALRAELAQRLEQHRRRLGRLQALVKDAFHTSPGQTRQRGRLLGLRLVVRQERGWVEWCEEALEFLPDPRCERIWD